MSSKGNRHEGLKLILIVLWLAFTVLFALWWFRFSLENISQLAILDPSRLDHWARSRRMILWEGTSWLVLLAIGGISLIVLVQKERGRVQRIREFFASFSHEVKTSLASLRVQAEALKDEKIDSPILDRLIGDTVRLQLQLENSLFLSSQEGLKLFVEPLALEQLIERMREQWPSLDISLNRHCLVHADERALRTILSNLLQNAIVHGGATVVKVDVSAIDQSRIQILVGDNGSGFEGALENLGQLFHRPKSTSGSGLGLYICKLLLRKMDGDLILRHEGDGFRVHVLLKGSML